MSNKIVLLRVRRDLVLNQLRETLDVGKQAAEEEALKSMFKCRFRNVETLYKEFQNIHQDLLATLSAQKEPDFQADDDIRRDVDDVYYSILDIYETLFANSHASNLRASPSSENVADRSNAKLPKINLPHFGGELREWPVFRDLFESLIHKNSSLTNIERFQYLLASLSKEPLSLVKSLPISCENYEIAYNSLHKRYQNKRTLASYYWKQIQNLPKVNEENPKALRNLLNSLSENLEALKGLGFPIREWDFILFMHTLDRLDKDTRRQFETSITSIEMPSFSNLTEFLTAHCRALDSASFNTSAQVAKVPLPHRSLSSNTGSSSKTKSFVVCPNQNLSSSSQKETCPACSSNHCIYDCPEFRQKSPFQRYQFAKDKSLCLNCLRGSHHSKNCTSRALCRRCRHKHHTLLHFDKPETRNTNSDSSGLNSSRSSPDRESSNRSTPVNVMAKNQHRESVVLLSTALIKVYDAKGNLQLVRALLDSASAASFITQKCLRKLGLSLINRSKIDIQGVGQTQAPQSKGYTVCKIIPVEQNEQPLIVDLVVLPTICANLPSTLLDPVEWKHVSNLQLADPHFNVPGPIDILLGADVFPDILKEGRLAGRPSAIETVFGWVLIGKTTKVSSQPINSFCISVTESLDNTLKRFWEVEEVPSVSNQSPEEQHCEKLFVETVRRSASGRYIVSLPRKDMEASFGETRTLALKRFMSLESRLIRNPELYRMYTEFMQDYLDNQHMEKVSESSLPDKCYYIPQHCVLRPERTTTKLRVVFDASAKTPNNKSLNETLWVGPKLQQNIFVILLNFRTHAIVLIADVTQMYRQVLISPHQRDLQRIVWRPSPDVQVEDFRLNTITYGVSCAPYLALRTIKQLALDERETYPLAASVLERDIYIDDIVTGCDSLEGALKLQEQLVGILRKGGFELHKWSSNNSFVLETVPEKLRHSPVRFDSESNNGLKVLGLQWSPSQDVLSYQIELTKTNCTKRSILSELSRIFDPLGFLAPISFFAKHLMQHLWCLGLDWDESPPGEVIQKWNLYKSQLSELAKVHVPRRVTRDECESYELHGFCDASERGYAAVVYLRSINSQGQIDISLICAKTKIAPLKKISIPRLELCAAVLLTNLIALVIQIYSCRFNFHKVVAWSDSSVVLSWIKTPPYLLKTFVSNRVSHIQQTSEGICWSYVASVDNPADCASRGLFPAELVNYSLWWAGPHWLSRLEEFWPPTPALSVDSSLIHVEERSLSLIVTHLPNRLNELLNKYSSLSKIVRIVAYILRFVNKIRYQKKCTGAFCEYELHEALSVLVKVAQTDVFASEIQNIRSQKPCSKPLRSLHPFLDKCGILRVGGRLHHSELPYEQKHPSLLPRRHRLTELIIEDTHRKYLHPGLKQMFYLLLQNFWILSSRRAIRYCLSKCIRCFKTRPRAVEPLMGALPAFRVKQAKAFQNVGVDFAGPFVISLGRPRGTKSKAYICLFVCLATKALHLEIVSDLSSKAFLAALHRFIARRGRCNLIVSDCGTNFVGASRELSLFMEKAAEEENIKWQFNPPSAAHFGGIWEAGVKSVKKHLFRVVGDQILTFEELYTVITQIEAVLNSRPLCPLTADPSDLSVLTPGHFLTLAPLTSVPCPDVTDVKLNRLSRWELLNRMHQDFWKRWHQEYLHTLQQRVKWTKNCQNLSLDTLVLIKNENLPPLKWSVARVVNLHPGADGIVRVATVRTNQGTFKRPITKLCPLPNQ